MDNTKPQKGRKWKAFDFGGKAIKSDEVQDTKISGAGLFEIMNNIDSKKELRAFNFDAKLSPKQIGDLAVHPKKLQELQKCLLQIISQNRTHPQFLLLTGPSGSGKSTALRVICHDLDIEVQEWINPIDQDFEVAHESQISKFLDFLIGSKYRSLFQTSNTHITVVKDFPNVVIRHPEQFRNILEELWYKTKMPIVFICTEVNNKNVNLLRNIFSDNIIKDFQFKQVDFNPCAPTLMKNAIKRAQTLTTQHPDLFSQPNFTIVEAIIATSMGDIRNAMNQFYLSSLKGCGKVALVIDKNESHISTKKRKKKNVEAKIKSMEMDETLGLFHGLGRVFNPKFKIHKDSQKLNCDIEKLIDEFSTQPNIFISFLFENYLKYFGDFYDATQAAGILSVSVKFLENCTERHDVLLYGLWISVLGLMISNRNKVSKWTQIRGPTKIKKNIVDDITLIGFDISDIFYCNLIRKSVKHKNLICDINDCDSDELIVIDDD